MQRIARRISDRTRRSVSGILYAFTGTQIVFCIAQQELYLVCQLLWARPSETEYLRLATVAGAQKAEEATYSICFFVIFFVLLGEMVLW